MDKQTHLLSDGKPRVGPHGSERYLIDPGELQEGQKWHKTLLSLDVHSTAPPESYGPVWVDELLYVTVDYPEVAWVDGYPVVMLNTIPEGSVYAYSPSGVEHHKAAVSIEDRTPVILLAWPDGSKPERPEAQEPTASKMDTAALFKERLGDLLMTDWYYGQDWRKALGYSGLPGVPSYMRVIITDDSAADGIALSSFVARITEEMSEFFTLQPTSRTEQVATRVECHQCGGQGTWVNVHGESIDCPNCFGGGSY